MIKRLCYNVGEEGEEEEEEGKGREGSLLSPLHEATVGAHVLVFCGPVPLHALRPLLEFPSPLFC